MSDGGKGSSPRPFSVPVAQFNDNFERIFGRKPAKCSACAGTGIAVTYQRDGKTEAYRDTCKDCDGKGST
jgi:hypothetical protein